MHEAMRKKSVTPMSKDRDETPACNKAADLQLWSNKYSVMLISVRVGLVALHQ